MKTTNLFPCLGVASRAAWVLPALIAVLNLLPAGRVTAQTFTTLHSFNYSSDGATPYAGLILSGSNTLYGTARDGGNNAGTVFALNTDGTGFTNLHNNAGNRAGLILSGNTLYGTADSGGSSGNGTVFAVNTDGMGFTNLHSFTATSGSDPNFTNSDGANPYAGLLLSGDTLYGTASGGGSWGY